MNDSLPRNPQNPPDSTSPPDTAPPPESATPPPRYDLEARLLAFSVRIIRFVEALPQTRTGAHLGGQLLRSGTAALPNHGEAQGAESRADFTHKLRICLKELRETARWIRLAQQSGLAGETAEAADLLAETEQLIRIFSASLRTLATSPASRHKH